MSDPWVITKLERKYRELRAAKDRRESEVKLLGKQMAHVEAVIGIFRADLNGQSSSRLVGYTPSRWARRGDGIRTALAVLRTAGAPLTTNELVQGMFAAQSLPPPTIAALRAVNASMQRMLRRRAGRDIVKIEGRPIRWAIGDRETAQRQALDSFPRLP